MSGAVAMEKETENWAGLPETWQRLMRTLAPDRRRAMAFLAQSLPQSDLDCYPPELFLQFADHALALRKQAPWCAALEPALFCHYVLCPRVNDEDLSFHRDVFYQALWPRVCAAPSEEERVLEVNRWCHELASYELQDDRTASPLTVYRSGSGRCGEESAFLVAALRSVGIAARQVYCPRWSHCDDNHAWVEAWCGGRWRFLGACEPEPVLDRGWFHTAASRAMLIHSRTFGRDSAPVHGPFLCQEGGVCWYNQTARYAQVRETVFRALRDGVPAAGAVFQLQVLNEAGYHTIATLLAGANGEARAELGMGDLHVLAVLDGLRAEGDCRDGAVTLHLAPPVETTSDWTDFDVYPPRAAAAGGVRLDAAQKRQRAAELQRGSALRQARICAFAVPQPEAAPWADLLRGARGNAAVLAAFLSRDGDPRREALVRTLTPKDLRDVSLAVLEDHLQHAPACGALPRQVYNAWVLCPRVELERLTPWRGALKAALPPADQAAYRANPAALWADMCRRMDTGPAHIYANLAWTPEAAWQAGRCDGRSLRILYVALLRTLGVPARLRASDGMPEFWQNGAFWPVRSEEMGELRLTHAGGTPPPYRQSWTLSRRTAAGWQQLRLDDGGWTQGTRTLWLPAGQYRLLTAVRLPNGNQFASVRELHLAAGAAMESSLRLRPYALTDLLGRQGMPPMSAVTLEGTAIPDLWQIGRGCPALLFWLEEGCEPTEHVLNELAAAQAQLAALPVKVVFLLRDRQSLAQPTLARVLAGWPGICVALDDWAYDLEQAARCLTCDPSTPPMAVACDGAGQAVYGVSGYHVGSVELLTRIARHLCGELSSGAPAGLRRAASQRWLRQAEQSGGEKEKEF